MLRNGDRRPEVLFIDDGGVLNDNARRAPGWLSAIGELMPPALGGTPEDWMTANRGAFQRVWSEISPRMAEFPSHAAFYREYALGWMNVMCGEMGVATPRDNEALALYREVSILAAERADAAIEGAAESVRALHRAGYTLHMASGTPSWELEAILTRMDVRDRFQDLYGPDIIDRVKYGRAFYEGLFEHAGVEPERALVIESDPECCGWAREAGARAVQVDAGGNGDAVSLAAVASMLV